jgi:predicted tellurium resistance membrane protein TerC
MADAPALDNIVTLGMLTLLQAVLGFDNLLYITVESTRAPADQQRLVRRLGIGIAVVLRIALLFVLIHVIRFFEDPVFGLQSGILAGEFNLHSLIVLAGGVFIVYTATKEILHMMNLEELAQEERKPGSAGWIIFWIVSMNMVFSFDSILVALALTDVFWVMAAAIIIGGLLMIWLADRVARFLQKNKMYQVLGLFILLVVGIMLLTDGGHLAGLRLFGHEIKPMTKATFYFVIAVLVLTEIAQSRYQMKLVRLKRASMAGPAPFPS